MQLYRSNYEPLLFDTVAHSNAIILNYVPSKDCEQRYESFMALYDLLPEPQAEAITENFRTIFEWWEKRTTILWVERLILNQWQIKIIMYKMTETYVLHIPIV